MRSFEAAGIVARNWRMRNTLAVSGLLFGALCSMIATWAFITVVPEIVAAISLRPHVTNEFWLISAYAIVIGILMIALSLYLRADSAAVAAKSTG
jgi:hypothetical protein